MPEGAFEYAPPDYAVFTRDIHGTSVEVAIHQALTGSPLLSGSRMLPEADLANLLFHFWEQHRAIFGDYPYDRFVVVVRGPGDEPLGYYMNSTWGLEVSSVGFDVGGTQQMGPPHGATDPFAYDWMAHELFHTWNGNLIARVPRPDSPFQPETWFVEGVTIYYTARSNPKREDFHKDILENWYDRYLGESPADRSLSFEEMGDRVPPSPDGPPVYNEYVELLQGKGALVAFLLDQRLRGQGLSLDDVMATAYQRFGLSGTQYTNADLLTLVEDVAGTETRAWLDTYVSGSTPLPNIANFDRLP